jgi:DNA-binding Xre family transcriptional regulator
MKPLIYRDKQTKQIKKYDLFRKQVDDIDKRIAEYNLDEKNNMTVELIEGGDIMSLVEIAEKNKRIRLSEVNDICHALDNLQTEIYQLKETVAISEGAE